MSTRIKAIVVPVAEGITQLAHDVEGLCTTLEQHGCEIVSVSHAAQSLATHGEPMWTVLIAYRDSAC